MCNVFFLFRKHFICNAIVAYSCVLISITFVPLVKKNLKYPKWIHSLVYYFPMLIPAFIYKFNTLANTKMPLCYVVENVFVSIFVILLNIRQFRNNINDNISKVPISSIDFFLEIKDYLIAVISEEIFFRYFLINILSKYGILSVVLSSIMFVHAHYVNRWAKKMFDIKSYISLFILGVGWGLIYYKTNFIFGSIIGHIVYNISEIVVLLKRTRIKEETYFDDY